MIRTTARAVTSTAATPITSITLLGVPHQSFHAWQAM